MSDHDAMLEQFHCFRAHKKKHKNIEIEAIHCNSIGAIKSKFAFK